MSHDTEEWYKIWRKSYCLKNNKNLVNLIRALKSLKN